MKQGETFEARSCPHCGVFAKFDLRQRERFSQTPFDNNPFTQEEIPGYMILSYQCQHCKRNVIYILLGKYKGSNLSSAEFEPTTYEQYYPKGNKRPLPLSIPDDILKDFEEACNIEYLSPNGASIIASRALQNTIRKHLPPSKHGRLYNELEEFTKMADLPKELKEMANVVREFSNIARHPQQLEDISINVTSEEVGGILDFTQHILGFFYEELLQRQNKLEQLKKKVADKKKMAPAHETEKIVR